MTGELEPIEFLLEATNLGGYGWPAAAIGAATWFLGPSIKKVRSNLAQWTDYQSANVLGLFRKIKARQDELAPLEPMHPRVAMQILETASWTDDDTTHEYLAGLTLDAATDGGSDEALFYARIVDGMTSAQIRAHYASYRAILDGALSAFEIGFTDENQSNTLWVPALDIPETIGVGHSQFAAEEPFLGLSRSDLISFYAVASPDQIERDLLTSVSEMSAAIGATPLGAALFTRAHGVRYGGIESFFGLRGTDVLGRTFPRTVIAPLTESAIAF